MEPNDRIGRRHFAAQLALGAGSLTAATTPLASACGADQPPAISKSGAAKAEQGGNAAEKKPNDPATSPELPPAEVLLLTYLTRRHPSDHYDDAAIQGIFRDIRGDVARGKQLSEFPLTNADEPASVFAAYRASSLPEN